MKIVHICPYFQPKLGYQETFLAKAQIKQGHDITVITSDAYFPYRDYAKIIQPILGKRLVGVGNFVEEGIPTIRLQRKFEFWNRVYLKNLEKSLTQIQPDLVIVHATCSLLAWQAARAKVKIGYQLICDDHMHLSIILQNKWLKKIVYKFFSLLFMGTIKKRTDKFVAITEETRQIMQDYYSIPKTRIEVVELGVDTDLFRRDQKERKLLRQKNNILKDDIVFIYAGKFIDDKGPKLLIDALTEFMLKDQRIKIMLIGNGSLKYTNSMKENLKKHQLEDRVIWMTMQPNKEVYKYYSAADIGVWPKQESICMLEAEACEVPVIIKDSPSMRKRVKNQNGLTYEESNLENLKKQIGKMLKSDYQVMGKKGRKLILKDFSWDKIAQRFIKI